MGNVELQKNEKDLDEIKKSLKSFLLYEVLVGVPEVNADRKASEGDSKEPVTNAQLVFIHDNGADKAGRNKNVTIPKREILNPPIEKNMDKYTDMLKDALLSALDGDSSSALMGLEAVGMEAANDIQDNFTGDNGWAPLKSKTLKRKTNKKGQTRSRPLLNTSQMQRSITYAVRKVRPK